MRFCYVVLFLSVFAVSLFFFQRAAEGPAGPEQPIEARVELHVPGMT